MKQVPFISIVALLLVGCYRTPEACFDAPAEAEVGQVIALENCSQKADFYKWDLGNGLASESDTPSVSYTGIGLYTVTLFAYSKHGYKVDSISSTIAVKPRYLDRIVVRSIDFNSPSGSPWDVDGTDPDLWMEFKSTESQVFTFSTDTVLNVAPSALPVELPLAGSDIVLSDLDWQFRLREVSDFSSTIMFDGFANPGDGEENPIVFSEGAFEIELWWRLSF